MRGRYYTVRQRYSVVQACFAISSLSPALHISARQAPVHQTICLNSASQLIDIADFDQFCSVYAEFNVVDLFQRLGASPDSQAMDLSEPEKELCLDPSPFLRVLWEAVWTRLGTGSSATLPSICEDAFAAARHFRFRSLLKVFR